LNAEKQIQPLWSKKLVSTMALVTPQVFSQAPICSISMSKSGAHVIINVGADVQNASQLAELVNNF